MNVNLEKLNLNLNKLNKLIDDYENNYYNYYNEIFDCNNYWHDEKSMNFFNEVNLEKLKVAISIEELRKISSLYDFISSKYSKIGNIVKADIGLKNDILFEVDNFLNLVCDSIDDIKNIDATFSLFVVSELSKYVDKLVMVSNLVRELKEKLKSDFNFCEDAEKEINLKITKINITFLNSIDNRNSFLGD